MERIELPAALALRVDLQGSTKRESERVFQCWLVLDLALLEEMGEPLLDELNRIFNLQPGPTLRHDVAHGPLSEGQCCSADVIYACWLLYRVCCLPLLTRWDEFVRPGLAIEEPGR